MKKTDRLKEKLQRNAEESGIVLDEEDHNELKAIMAEEGAKVKKRIAINSFEHLFGNNKLRLQKVTIKWCLYLRNKSSGAYEALRNSGCVCLPSQRTLRDYTHCFESTVGFSNMVDQMLMNDAKLNELKDWEKIVGILVDEMYVREDLIYCKHSGHPSGFSNLGEINEHLLKYEKPMKDPCNVSKNNLAKTVMMFMVKGAFTELQFPYAFFPCCDVSGYLLHKPMWDCIYRLERCGFKVLFVTADGASVNHALFRKHDSPNKLLYKVPSKYANDGRQIFFFSDPPHLLKTAINCWASSYRTLKVNYFT